MCCFMDTYKSLFFNTSSSLFTEKRRNMELLIRGRKSGDRSCPISATARWTNTIQISHTHKSMRLDQPGHWIFFWVVGLQSVSLYTNHWLLHVEFHLLRAQICCSHSHFVLQLWWKSGDLVAEECFTAWPCIYCSRASSFSLIESFYIYVFFWLDVSYMCTSINANLVVSVRETSFYSIIIMQRPSGNFTEDRGCV